VLFMDKWKISFGTKKLFVFVYFLFHLSLTAVCGSGIIRH